MALYRLDNGGWMRTKLPPERFDLNLRPATRRERIWYAIFNGDYSMAQIVVFATLVGYAGRDTDWWWQWVFAAAFSLLIVEFIGRKVEP